MREFRPDSTDYPKNKRFKNETGKTHGRLYVETYAGSKKGYGKGPEHYWQCTCACGSVTFARGNDLRTGVVVSCGCQQKENFHNKTHQMSRTPVYVTYMSMIQRCQNPKQTRYELYGGRGITVCDRWMKSFDNFYEDMGDKPKGSSIERIDNDGNYEPSNCRWASQSEQLQNQSRTKLTADDVRDIRRLKEEGMTAKAIVKHLGLSISPHTVPGVASGRKWPNVR